MTSIRILKHLAFVSLVGLLSTACGHDAPSSVKTEDTTATAHSTDMAMVHAQWTAFAMTATARPTITPTPSPTWRPRPTWTPLPENVPVVYPYGAIPEGTLMRLGIGRRLSSALSPDRRLYAIGTTAGIYVFDTSTMQMIWAQTTRSEVKQIEWTNDSRLVIARLSEGNTIPVWDAQTGAQVYHLEHTRYPASMELSPDGNRLAVGSGRYISDHDPNAVAIWDMAKGSRAATWADPADRQYYLEAVVDLDWSPDGRMLAAVTGYHISTLFEVGSGRVLHTFEQPEEMGYEIQFVKFSPDGSKLAAYTGLTGPSDISPSGDRRTAVWDVASGALLLLLENKTAVVSALWSPDGKSLLTEGQFGDIRVWDVPTGTLLQSPDNQLHYSWSRDSQHIIFGQPYAPAYWFDIRTGLSEKKPVEPPQLPPDAAPIAISETSDGAVSSDAFSGEYLALLKLGNISEYGLWSPDGRMIAMIPNRWWLEFPLSIWDTADGVPVQTVSDVDPLPTWVPERRMADDYRWCLPEPPPVDPTGKVEINIEPKADSDYQETIIATDMSDRARTYILEDDASLVCSMAFSQDGHWLAIGHMPETRGMVHPQVTNSDENAVTVWDMRTGELVGRYVGHTGTVVQVAWSPDGTRLASISRDETAIIWPAPGN